MEWAYLAAGVGPMALVVTVGLWGDRLVTTYCRKLYGR